MYYRYMVDAGHARTLCCQSVPLVMLGNSWQTETPRCPTNDANRGHIPTGCTAAMENPTVFGIELNHFIILLQAGTGSRFPAISDSRLSLNSQDFMQGADQCDRLSKESA